MFWKGKVSWFVQIEAFLRQRELCATCHQVQMPSSTNLAEIAKPHDAPGIARLLNIWFEVNPRCSTAVTVTWVLESFIHNAIWVIVKDRGGTIRGCVCSTQCDPPYPNSTEVSEQGWGIVDWFCVHPLWRSKGLGSALLETLDYVTHQRGRRCHVFLKEGLPLPLPHVPVYATFLQCRRAGNASIVVMPSKKGVYPYMTKEKTGLPLVRVDLSVISDKDLDTMLPLCIVFSSSGYSEQGWKTDSLVSMYAFRWVAGKWLGSKPNSMII